MARPKTYYQVLYDADGEIALHYHPKNETAICGLCSAGVSYSPRQITRPSPDFIGVLYSSSVDGVIHKTWEAPSS